MAGGPRILVVDDDASMRRLVRTALELEGYHVVEAATLAQARSVGGSLAGVVLDRHLPDGDSLDAYADLTRGWSGADVVVHSAEAVPAGYPTVGKGDVVALIDRFGPATAVPPAVGVPDLALAYAGEIVDEWIELCCWDPELPAGSRPPVAESVVAAVAGALERPQPVGWGLDPALDAVAETYLLNHEALDVAVAQLVCLREAFDRKVVAELPAEDRGEALRRLTMIVERLMVHTVRSSLAADDVFVDAATGLGNRRAFEVDLQRETARAARHQRPLSVVRVVVEGLDLIAGGDDDLRVAGVVLGDLQAYRTGDRELTVLLPDEVVLDAGFVAERLAREALAVVASSVATYPQDPLDALDRLSEERLGVS